MQIGFVRFIIAFSIFATATLSAAEPLDCRDLFRSNPKTVIDGWLEAANLPVRSYSSDPFGRIGAFNEKMAMARLDARQLRQTSYQDWWVDKIVDLKLSRRLDPLDDMFLSLKPNQRKSLKRLIVRSIIKNGLESYLEENSADSKETIGARLLATARWIRFSPFYRLATESVIARDHIDLSPEQIALILSSGVDGIKSHSELRDLINQNKRDLQSDQVFKNLGRVIRLGLVIYATLTYSPVVNNAFDQAYEKAARTKTDQFLKAAKEATTDPGQREVMDLAKREEDTLIRNFEKKMKREPTAEERETARRYVCEKRLAAALGSPANIASCLAL